MQDKIYIKGARENNLKNIDVTIPRDKLVVLTGLSGSGKSSLAFDTIYAEGQRRYVESLSSYARMFLGQMEKPDVDYIDGLSPAISIDQKTTSKNPRSTVGTVTEIYDYLRLLWARVGTPHCPKCGKEIHQQTIDQIIDQVLALPQATRIQLRTQVRVQKRLDFIYTPYAEPVTFDQIAGAASVSRSEAARCFQEYMGCSPVNALIRYRLRTAHRLLHDTSLTVQEIAAACGFASAGYFARQFRKRYGCTPGSIRNSGE